MLIRLSAAQRALLKTCVEHREPGLIPELAKLGLAFVPHAKRLLLVEAVLDELMERGIDDGVPNELGRELESLIDALRPSDEDPEILSGPPF